MNAEMNAARHLVVVMQYWEGDREAAMEAARLIADVQQDDCKVASFMFAWRPGAEAPERKVVSELTENFGRIGMMQSKGREHGWPDGCNSLWREVMLNAVLWARQTRREDVGVLTIEPDCVPLTRDWLVRIAQAWSEARSRGKLVLGHRQKEPIDHVNGNAVWSANLFDEVPRRAQIPPYGKAWDDWGAQFWLDRAEATGLIRSVWRMEDKGVTEEAVFAEKVPGVRVAMLHGVKTDAARRIVRNKVLGGSET